MKGSLRSPFHPPGGCAFVRRRSWPVRKRGARRTAGRIAERIVSSYAVDILSICGSIVVIDMNVTYCRTYCRSYYRPSTSASPSAAASAFGLGRCLDLGGGDNGVGLVVIVLLVVVLRRRTAGRTVDCRFTIDVP